MRMRKVTLVLVAIALILSIAGCSAQPAQTSGSAEPSGSQTQVQNPSASVEQSDAQPKVEQTQKASAVSTAKPKNGTKFVIGVSLPAPEGQWIPAIIRNAQTEGETDKDMFDVTVTTANNPAKQVADVEDLLIKNPDAMVIFPIESAPLTPICDKIKQAGIPLVVLTRGIESSSYDTYIHGDDYSGGVNAAHYIGKRLNGKGKVVMMKCKPSVIEQQRTLGFEETRAKFYPGIEVIAIGQGDFSMEISMKSMENILQAQPQIDAVYSHDDEQAQGCIAAIKAAGREKEMFVTGYGGNKAALKMLMDGDPIYGATFFYSPLQSGSAVRLAKLFCLKVGMSDLWERSVPREIIFSCDTITSENAKDYYNPDSPY